jgi:hypothetical protein
MTSAFIQFLDVGSRIEMSGVFHCSVAELYLFSPIRLHEMVHDFGNSGKSYFSFVQKLSQYGEFRRNRPLGVGASLR